MPTAPTPLPDELSSAVFSTQEARRAGVTRARLRASDLSPLTRGLWVRSDRVLSERAIVAALCRRDPAVFAMGLTAARLLGFPMPGVFEREVVSAPERSDRGDGRSGRGPDRGSADLRIHLGTGQSRRRDSCLVRWSLRAATVLDQDLLTLQGAPTVRTTSRIRTFLDLGSCLSTDALVAIGDHLVRRPRPQYEGRDTPYATIDDLTDAVARHRGRGTRRLREAVSQVRMSSDSPPETALRLAAVRAGLPEPLANVRAEQAQSEGAALDLGEPDLHWPQWRVALEHEGPSHLDRNQVPRDIARGERRRDAGWIEVRTTFEDLPDGCRSAVARVRKALERQGWRLE